MILKLFWAWMFQPKVDNFEDTRINRSNRRQGKRNIVFTIQNWNDYNKIKYKLLKKPTTLMEGNPKLI